MPYFIKKIDLMDDIPVETTMKLFGNILNGICNVSTLAITVVIGLTLKKK